MSIIHNILQTLMDGVRQIMSTPDERGNLTSDLFRRRIREEVRRLISKSSGFLLDMGCGEGMLYENLSTKPGTLNIVGIDTSYKMLKTANEIFQKKGTAKRVFINALAQKLPMLDKSLDTVICINTFYNLLTKDDVKTSLEEMARVCKKDGVIIFDIRNKLNPIVYFSYKWVRFYDNPPPPLTAYSLKEIEKILHSKGLVVKETISLGFPITMFAPIIIVKAVYKTP